MELATFVADFAWGIQEADAKGPQAVNVRSRKSYQPGIGPHTEDRTVALIQNELEGAFSDRYKGSFATRMSYPENPRQKCDVCLGSSSDWKWAIEVKMLRFLGDNGKVNDNILMHVLSPYPSHRSALTDCEKLVGSQLPGRRAILIYGFDYEEWSLDPAIDAFEILAISKVVLGDRNMGQFNNLIHPIHKRGRVFGWEVQPLPGT